MPYLLRDVGRSNDIVQLHIIIITMVCSESTCTKHYVLCLQLIHTNWEENPDITFYSNYLQVVLDKDGEETITLTEGQTVKKGELIAYSHGTTNLKHIQFEIRVGSVYSKDACNPWKYLPNDDNDYSSFEVIALSLTPNYHGVDCSVVVNVSVSSDQLTFTRIELHITDNNDQPQEVRFYDMCGANSNHSSSEMDNWEYQDDLSSYVIRISPTPFTKDSTEAEYGFEFIHLPALSGNGKVMAKVFDVFDNSLSTEYETYSCSTGMTDPPAARYRNNPSNISPQVRKKMVKTFVCRLCIFFLFHCAAP